MAANRRLVVLLGALALTIALAVWWQTRGASQPAPGAARSGRAAPAAGQAASPGKLVDVRLDALEAERPAPGASGRNPFRFQARTAPVVATPAPAPGEQIESEPAVAAVPAGPPPPPPIALKFIGLVEKNGQKMAILSGPGYTLIGTEGQPLEGRYRILKIGVESIDIAYLDGRGRQTIRLTGQ